MYVFEGRKVMFVSLPQLGRGTFFKIPIKLWRMRKILSCSPSIRKVNVIARIQKYTFSISWLIEGSFLHCDLFFHSREWQTRNWNYLIVLERFVKKSKKIFLGFRTQMRTFCYSACSQKRIRVVSLQWY